MAGFAAATFGLAALMTTTVPLLAGEFERITPAEGAWHDEDKDGPCAARFSGPIRTGDAERFGQGPSYDGQPLCLNSSGGSLGVAMRLPTDQGWKPRVLPGDVCESACAIAFLRGGYVTGNGIPGFYAGGAVWAGGRLGFHAPALALPEEARVDRTVVEDAFDVALNAAAEVFRIQQKKDSAGAPIMNAYLFQRFLETPPDRMYYIDTVGDALLANIPIMGAAKQIQVTPDQIQTICENALMVSGEWQSPLSAPYTKANRPASAILADFRKELAEFNADGAGAESGGLKVRIVPRPDGKVLGFAGHYPSGDYRYFRQCYVEFDGTSGKRADDVGEPGEPLSVWLDSERFRPDSDNAVLERWKTLKDDSPSVVIGAIAIFPFDSTIADLPRSALYRKYFGAGSRAAPDVEVIADGFTKHIGRDILGQDLRSLSAADGDACLSACRGTPGCEAATFDRWNKLCFLKQIADGAALRLIAKATTYVREDKPVVPSITATAVWTRRDRTYPATADEKTDASDFGACAATCRDRGWCLGFVYAKPTITNTISDCSLYSEPPEYVASPGSDIGFLEQP